LGLTAQESLKSLTQFLQRFRIVGGERKHIRSRSYDFLLGTR
jgi:hypothetical protein